MNFTPELPTKPGAFWWKRSPDDEPTLVAVEENGKQMWQSGWLCGPLGAYGGLWSPRLVSVDEVALAWNEGGKRLSYKHSRAKRIAEGVE